MPIELDDIRSGYNLSKINSNFQRIEDAWDEKLDRLVNDQGNQMEQDIDMNSYRLINYPPTRAEVPTDLVRVDAISDFGDFTGQIPEYLGYTGDGITTDFQSPVASLRDNKLLQVYVGGLRQQPTQDYFINGSDVRFTTAPVLGVAVDIYAYNPAGVIDGVPVDVTNSLVIADGSTEARRLGDRFSDVVNIKDFGAVDSVAIDSTAAIQAAITYATSENKAVYIPSGQFAYSQDITFTCEAYGETTETSWLVKTAPATITVTTGSFENIKVAPLAPISGDTTNGVVANTTARKRIKVRTEDHGGDGFVFERGNLSQVVVYTRRNGGRGYVAAADTISGDNNCVDMWVEASSNTSTGFEIESNATASYMANCLRGYVISQNNGSTGDVDKDFNAILAGYDHSDLMIYCEFVGASVWLKPELFSSEIFLSVAAFGTIRDEIVTSGNTISYTYGARGDRRYKDIRSEQFQVKKEAFVGQLVLEQVADRDYQLNATGSGSEQTLTLGDTLTLQNSDLRRFVTRIIEQGTLNFGTINAHDTVERNFTFSEQVLSTSIVGAMPRYQLPAGITYDTYVLDADPQTVYIRCTNVTDANIAVPQGAWRVQSLAE